MELAGEKLHLNPALRPDLSSGKWYNRLARVRQGMTTTATPRYFYLMTIIYFSMVESRNNRTPSV